MRNMIGRASRQSTTKKEPFLRRPFVKVIDGEKKAFKDRREYKEYYYGETRKMRAMLKREVHNCARNG